MVTPRRSSPGIRHLLSGFLAGELDPMMGGRVDTDQYQFGLDTCENFLALELGPLVKRMGFQYIRDADPASSHVSAFRFSTTQEYVLEWTNGRVRFFTNGARVETSPGVPYELGVPYTAAEAPAVWSQQSYDRLYLDHPGHPPAAIARTSAVTFSYSVIANEFGPFKDENTDKTVTVTVDYVITDGTTPTTIHATAPIFQPGHVGTLFRVRAAQIALVAWEPGRVGVAVGEGYVNEGKEYVAQTAGTTGTIAPTHTEGLAWDGATRSDVGGKGPYGVQWKYLSDQFGIARITAVAGDGLSASAIVLRQMPEGTIPPTYRWSHSLFSDVEGYPAIVLLWQGRMVHVKGFDIVATVSGDFGGGRANYQTYTSEGIIAADMGFRRTLATEDPPLWGVADLKKLLLGTASKELAVGPTNSQAVVAGDNISMEPQSFYGSQALPPLQVGTKTLFVERGGRRIRAAGYDVQPDRYGADDLTVSARQITSGGIRQLAYQRWPFAFVHAVRSDGQIAVHSDTKLQVKGFSRIVLGGAAQALSAVSVVGADGVTDELWLLVARATPGGTRREIWKQAPWRELGEPQANAFYVDAGVSASAAANQTHFSGLTHLASQPVAVLADGAVVPNMTVAADGTLNLPSSAAPPYAFQIAIGLAYTATAITLPPEIAAARGTIQGLWKRARKVMLRLLETLGISVGGAGPNDPLEEVLERSAHDFMDQPIPLFTGDMEGNVDAEYDRSGRVRFVSDKPLPATITAAAISLEMDQEGV
jgi:hypothetical protein